MSNQSQASPVNFENVSDFLSAFFPDPNETIRLRAFAAKGRDAVVSARSFGVTRDQLTSLSDLQENLFQPNEERGLYFVVNSGGDSDAEIDRFNAFFAENDDFPLTQQHAQLDSCPLVPSIRVETLKSVHAYWLINDGCSESAWREIQQSLIEYFKGDEKIKNPARVMRLPHFSHVSYNPASENYSFKPVTVVKFDKDLRYTVEKMQKAFPPAFQCDASDHTANASTPTLTTWDELNAETRRRIRRLTPTPKLSGDGDWLHARGICHNGTGNTALYINLESGAYGCQKGCDAVAIRRAFGLPEQPQSQNGEEQFVSSWRDFSARAFEIREKIVAELEAGEVGVVFASTDVGKTTLALNLSLMLAAAGAFEPLVEPKEGGRRVFYIDGGSRGARLQADIRLMLRDWDDGENSLVDQNLYLACDTSLEGEQLDLTKRKHWQWLEDEAARVKPALIVLDTMVSLFSLNNENDNSEVSRKVMRPLSKLASDTGAAILLLHHIGKLSEDAQAGTKAYRGRGASAIGAAARLVLLLKQDSNDPDLVGLSCAKVKGKKFSDVLLKLQRDARWFVNTYKAPAKELTGYRRVIEFVTESSRAVKRSEIEEALKGLISESQIGRHLEAAVKRGNLIQPKYGHYAAPGDAQSLDAIDDEQVSNFKNGALPFQDLNAEDAHSVVA